MPDDPQKAEAEHPDELPESLEGWTPDWLSVSAVGLMRRAAERIRADGKKLEGISSVLGLPYSADYDYEQHISDVRDEGRGHFHTVTKMGQRIQELEEKLALYELVLERGRKMQEEWDKLIEVLGADAEDEPDVVALVQSQLAALRPVSVETRLPTKEDANEDGCVLYWHSKGAYGLTEWKYVGKDAMAWARVPSLSPLPGEGK